MTRIAALLLVAVACSRASAPVAPRFGCTFQCFMSASAAAMKSALDGGPRGALKLDATTLSRLWDAGNACASAACADEEPGCESIEADRQRCGALPVGEIAAPLCDRIAFGVILRCCAISDRRPICAVARGGFAATMKLAPTERATRMRIGK